MKEDLLLEIARCPLVEMCLAAPNSAHPCQTIVRSQHVEATAHFQVPEPWSGHLEHALLLFISSNLSISRFDQYPHGAWSDAAIVDFFAHRFGQGTEEWVRQGTKALGRNGSYLRATRFWASIKKRAIELLGPDVRPGLDYALTEVVHCKSKAEAGVPEAQRFCAERYLRRILTMANARVIVVLGRPAREALASIYAIPPDVTLYGPTCLSSRERILTFLPHPNARQARTFAHCLPTHELQVIRAFLRRWSSSSG